jgi:hypothetical protein
MAGPNALNELRTSIKQASPAKSESDKVAENKPLSELGKGPVTVIKHPSASEEDAAKEFDTTTMAATNGTKSHSTSGDEFMTSSESEFGTISGMPTKQSGNRSDNKSANKLESEADKLLSAEPGEPAINTTSPSTVGNNAGESVKSTESAKKSGESGDSVKELEDVDQQPLVTEEDDEDEKSAAELVAAAAAQIANKTIKKTGTATSGAKTLKATGKLLSSAGKQEQIMKKAMLMLNESGKINVVTEEQGPSIVKLNTPTNKAQIKLRSFRQNFEKQLAEMRRKTPLQMQTLKSELANIEFAEIGNKNIMAGLLELVDDHELKLLTIEKMLKHGDITLSF